jgi:DNA invertase Pin-like site-specific DNA recombinase
MEHTKHPVRRCAVYTRKSSEEGLEQDFNSLHAQREACEAFLRSQAGEGWRLSKTHYDDGGLSGATMERPALQRLLEDIRNGLVDVVVVYKVDRLTRSLADFAKMVEIFDAIGVSFVAVTQQFNTTTSMGRLTLNVLLSFAQFEREVTGKRIRNSRLSGPRRPAQTRTNARILPGLGRDAQKPDRLAERTGFEPPRPLPISDVASVSTKRRRGPSKEISAAQSARDRTSAASGEFSLAERAPNLRGSYELHSRDFHLMI